jgi:ribosomal protein L11 methyltransferase
MPTEAAAASKSATPRTRAARAQARWLEVAIRVPVAAAERLGGLLVDAGSQGVITGVQELARGRRRRTHETVRGFFASADPVRARLAVDAVLNALGTPATASWLALDDRLWEIDWRRHFTPIAVGRTLVIVPPWDHGVHARRRRIVIHPGMAFGTGQHATTHACLEAIEDLAEPAPARALDVGTGTGVLAIALAKLGVGEVRAIDTDPHAVAAARDNVRRNRVDRRVHVTDRPLSPGGARHAPPRRPFPLVVANLYVDALIGLEATFAGQVATGGHLVTSGVLRTQQGRLRRAFGRERWRLVRARRSGSWVTTILERRGPATTSTTIATRSAARATARPHRPRATRTSARRGAR